MKTLFRRFATLMRVSLAAALMLAPVTAALATTVTPAMIDLQSNGRRVVANVSVSNTGAGPLPIEIQVVPLIAAPAGLQPAKAGAIEDEDLLVTPPSALIPAGKTQTFRVQWIGDPELNASKHYYVSINQLPVKLPEGQSAVQVVYNFQVLVSVSAPNKKAQLSIASSSPATIDGKPAAAVTVQNNGQAHGYISRHRLKITETDSAGSELISTTISGAEFQQMVGYGLVASGQVRTVNVPLDKAARPGSRLTAVLLDERAQ